MRRIKYILIALLSSWYLLACIKEKNPYPSLEFIGLFQLDSLYGLKFDLSGIVQMEDSIYIIADKPWNKFLYSIKFDDSSFMVSSKKNLRLKDKIDLEGVDYCAGTTFLVNERQGLVYTHTQDGSIAIITANFDSLGVDPKNWGNSGWEGVAADCNTNTLYLIKEREPRSIFVIDTKNWKIKDVFNIPETESSDFSDAKFENGHLYVIERNGNLVTKIDPNRKSVVAKFHYKNIASHPNGKLFEPTNFGMGEALLLTKDEIWIGLDNNGLKVSEHARKEYGMSGKSPVILKFKRPEDF